MRRLITLIPLAAIGIAACGSSTAGFHNMHVLTPSVRTQMEKSARRADDHVTGVSCFSTSGGNASCFVKLSREGTTTLTVTISKNGNEWTSR